jgi:threonine/homoserine/homoserine lactone efflux protein
MSSKGGRGRKKAQKVHLCSSLRQTLGASIQLLIFKLHCAKWAECAGRIRFFTASLGVIQGISVHFEHWFAFVAASTALLILPGPTILTVIGYSVSHGRRANLPLVAGVALGDSTALLVSLVGLGTLLATSAFWFTVVKWVGGLYLLYLGVKLLRTKPILQSISKPEVPASLWRLFANTYLVTALNPKGIVFFVAFLPQFLSASAPITFQLWVLGSTFVVLATLNAGAYAIFASAARGLLMSPRAQRNFNLAGGSLMSAAGVWALLAKRPAQ